MDGTWNKNCSTYDYGKPYDAAISESVTVLFRTLLGCHCSRLYFFFSCVTGISITKGFFLIPGFHYYCIFRF